MMIICVDVDSVLADLQTPWLLWHNRRLPENKLRIDDITDWGMDKLSTMGDSIYDYLKLPGIYDDVLPIIDSRLGVANLYQFGRVVFATTSPLEGRGEKYRWLKEWEFLLDDKNYLELKDKSLIRADVLIDDNYDNIMSFVGLGILFDQPWNRKYEYSWRMLNWNDKRYLNWIENYSKKAEI